MAYFILGRRFTQLLSSDFIEYAPQLLEVVNGGRNSLGVFGHGTSTGGMIALSGFILLFSFESIYGACLLLSIWAFAGQVAILEVMRANLPQELHERLAIAAMLIPSVVFWSSGLLKEAPAMGAFGFLLLGANWIVWGRRYIVGAILVLASAYVVGITKSYILFAFFAAAAVWLFWHRSTVAEKAIAVLARPFYLAVGTALVVLSLAALSVLFPRFAPENLAGEAAQLQALYARQGGARRTISVRERRALSRNSRRRR